LFEVGSEFLLLIQNLLIERLSEAQLADGESQLSAALVAFLIPKA
jgi:hypothetical protein